MMKQPWKIWSAFVLTLLLLVAATFWLSIKAIELDNRQQQDRIQTELARREAELQERVNSALYRMDWVLTPLISQEAARPYYLYDSFYRPPAAQSGGVKGKIRTLLSEEPSPLLMETSEFVHLHFQLSKDNQISSPQRPTGLYCQMAITACGITENAVTKYDPMLEKSKEFADFNVLQLLCPSDPQEDSEAAGSLSRGQTVYLDNQFNFRDDNSLAMNAPAQQIVDALQQQKPLGNNALEIQRNRGENRQNYEYKKRQQSAQKFALQQWNNLASNPPKKDRAAPIVREGMMRPVWVKDKLLLLRQVKGKNRELVQCCWLNWERIREELVKEVKDILPDVQFAPVSPEQPLDFGRALASLPIQVVVDSEKLLPQLAIAQPLTRAATSGIRWALILAWAGLLFAAVAVALLLRGVIQLSERRAAFVSAVTHELRTPLTTFKMYAEMLAAEMVPEEKKKDYALTLTSQANRLSHLVENVLQFARLEKVTCHSKQTQVPLEQVFEPFRDRLEQRTADCQMGLNINIESKDRSDERVTVELSKLEQIVFNLVDNACKYGQGNKNEIDLTAEVRGRKLIIGVRDYGPGVAKHVRKKLFQPFSKSDQEAANSAAGVGLGLALCQRMVATLRGKLKLVDVEPGAKFEITLPANLTG